MPINLVNNAVYTVNPQPISPPIAERPKAPERNPKHVSENTDDESLYAEEPEVRELQPSERKRTNVGNNIDIKI